MSWLFDVLLELILALMPWGKRDRRSSMGESRMDRQARIMGAAFLMILLVVAAAVWWFWK